GEGAATRVPGPRPVKPAGGWGGRPGGGGAAGLIPPACGAPAALEGVVGEEGIRAPTPIAFVAQQDLVRRRQPIVQDGGHGLEKDALILALGVAAGAPAAPRLGARKGPARELAHPFAAGRRAPRRPPR